MFDKSYSNNSQFDAKVSTNLCTLFSDTGLVTLRGFNNSLSVSITPCSGVDANGIRQYDRNRKIVTALTMENLQILDNFIEKELKPAIEQKKGSVLEEPISSTVLIGAKNGSLKKGFQISYEMKETTPTIYLRYFQKMEEDMSVKPENVTEFIFNKTACISGFDWKSGKGKETIEEATFFVFASIIKFSITLLPIAYHGERYADATHGQGEQSQNSMETSNGYAQTPPSMFDNGMFS